MVTLLPAKLFSVIGEFPLDGSVVVFILTWSVLGNLRKIYDDDNGFYFIKFQHFVVMFARLCIF